MSWKDIFPKENRYFGTENGILYCGDCLEIMKKFPKDSIDLILTDPPYQYLKHKLDIPFDENGVFNELKRITNKNSSITLFGRGPAFYKWNVMLNDLGFKFKEELIWDKGRTTSPCLPIGRIHETISIRQKGNKIINRIYIDKLEYDFNANEWHRLVDDMKRLINKLNKINDYDEFKEWLKGEYVKVYKRKHNIVNKMKKCKDRAYQTYKAYTRGILFKSIIRVNREHYKFKHPTQKPLKLMEYLLNVCSNKNDIILDCFGGSGTTLLACEKLNRKWIGIEIYEEYCEIAKQRLSGELNLKMGLPLMLRKSIKAYRQFSKNL